MNLENFLSNSIDLLNKYDLEPEELFYSYLIYCNNLEDTIKYCGYVKDRRELKVKMIDGKKIRIPKKYRLSDENIQRMVDNGVIMPTIDFDKEYNFHDTVLTGPFEDDLKKIYNKDLEASYGQEFWEAYPFEFNSNGKSFRLKATNKELVIKQYNNLIQDEETHNKIMDILKTQKVNMKITNFLESEAWKEFKDAKPSQSAIDHFKIV